MIKEKAVEEIKRQWPALIGQFTREAPRRVNGAPSYVCPLCGNGSGRDGTGIAEDPGAPGYFKCFKCGFYGDIIQIAREVTDADYNQTVNSLAGALGIAIDNQAPGNALKTAQNGAKPAKRAEGIKGASGQENAPESFIQTEKPIEEKPPVDYSEFLLQAQKQIGSPAAVDYLNFRGISLETARRCNVGFCPAWVSPTGAKTARARGHNPPPPSPRLIFPCDGNRSYTTRYSAPDSEIPEKSLPYKKQNEGEPGEFNGAALYNQAPGPVFITEGVFSALSIIEAGGNAAALNSANRVNKFLERLEIQRIPRGRTLIIALDNDDAGRAAAEKLESGLKAAGVDCIQAPEINCGYKDENDALVNDRKTFFRAVQKAIAGVLPRPDTCISYLDNQFGTDIKQFAAAEIKTGFAGLDSLNGGGLHPGFYLLAGSPSLGKTTLAWTLAENIARAGGEAIYISLEQSKLELVSKSIARRIAEKDIEEGSAAPLVTELEIKKGANQKDTEWAIEMFRAEIGERLSVYEGDFEADINNITAYIKTYMKRTGARPVVVLDYLQLAAPGTGARDIREAVDRTATALKRLSREANILIIAISSMGRASYFAPFSFTSLKESGGLEYTADVVWGLQPAVVTSPEFTECKTESGKQALYDAAKIEIPRQIDLVAVKNRFGISNYTDSFLYYPTGALFVEAPGIPGGNPVNARA